MLAIRANGQQFTSFGNGEGNFHLANRWIDPFFPLNIHANMVSLAPLFSDKTKAPVAKETIDKVNDRPAEVTNSSVEHNKPKAEIKYSSSRASTLYRVTLDKQLDEHYDGKQVFVDAKGVKYIIDSKYRKKIIK
ncbi:hypothetical protein [Sphingobacterium sp.]|uniref:hypothetical protein n=1 Tax=Sphingobacterium sp. TaxID=341027 RepID=UPI0031E04E0A